MDEQRSQAYLSLIQELLECPSGEESDVLNRHRELVDEGFVQVCEQVAEQLQEEGEENQAQFLRNVAQEVGAFLGRGKTQRKANPKEYSQFLTEVLQAIFYSNGNPAVVYPLFRQNLDKLDLNLAQILTVWARGKFSQVNVKQAADIAAVIGNFANLIAQLPLGRRADNLEIAIAALELALEVYSYEAFPEQWATIQNNLGNAYHNRIKGERADNLERAIAALELALEVYSREAFPEDWAMTQNNLGNAYNNRIKGERADNLEKAVATYQLALEVYSRETFPEDWAGTQNNLGAAYSNRIKGERADNLEKAIATYQLALEVYSHEAFPEQWAMTQHNLGSAYLYRIKGERADNLDQAITAYQLALEVRTREAFPKDWARTQNNLGNAYLNHIKGERADNLEQAIAGYQLALEVRTREAFPEDWAATQNNLGNAYLNRIKGERADNLEKTIATYQLTLEVYTREAFPEDWAATQNNLGTAYSDRIKGERADNLEKAITALELALEVSTREAFPKDWAETQNNLGNAYCNRIKGERADNLERAIAALEVALEVSTREAFPKDWAMAQNNLGNAYCNRIKGERADNLEEAITTYQLALEVYTREAFPYDWAMTQNNLGAAYLYRVKGERADNLEQAIVACKLALTIYTREAFPYEWARTQNNLGAAYLDRIKGERTNNLEQVIAAYRLALEVRTREAFPQDHIETLFNFGLAYQKQSQHYTHDPKKKQKALENAYNTFDQALDTVEYLRGEIISGDEAKRKLNEEWVRLYRGMVEVCLELGKYTDAIEYVDRSKARNLTELIATRDAYPGGEISSEVRQRLQQLRQAISEEDRRLKQDPNPNYTHISQLREEFQANYPYKPLKFSDIQSLLDDETVILEWYILDEKFLTFTLTNQTLNLWISSEEDRQNLIDWTVAYIDDYDNNSQWRDSLPQRLETLAQILHLDEILTNLRQQLPNCQKLILIPHLALHLFPLHALPVATEDGEGKFLQDLFPKGVGYAPNCQVLQQAQNRSRPNFNRLFAIQNPTQDLQFTDMEVEAIQSLFNPHQVLKHDQAEKAAIDAETLKNDHCIHFSCHGYFNFEDALKSALILAKSEFTPPPPTDDPSRYLPLKDNKLLDLKKCLTLEDILRLDLTNCRLVTLSACETGITDITSTSDEYIGLPSGFILAGSPNVVSTLWAVADISTAIFMIQFYQTLQQQPDLSVVLALRQTQTWLREATVQDLLDWVDSCAVISEERRKQMQKRLAFGSWKKKLDAKRFESPYYWAAFCAIGA
ncbi:CHAT domain-containing protein [Limnospira platensis]|uniref:CHAT domain-containing protein n=1 Tax=Limnospira platensis TaxID=118562 RepID=UPI003397DC70